MKPPITTNLSKKSVTQIVVIVVVSGLAAGVVVGTLLLAVRHVAHNLESNVVARRIRGLTTTHVAPHRDRGHSGPDPDSTGTVGDNSAITVAGTPQSPSLAWLASPTAIQPLISSDSGTVTPSRSMAGRPAMHRSRYAAMRAVIPIHLLEAPVAGTAGAGAGEPRSAVSHGVQAAPESRAPAAASVSAQGTPLSNVVNFCDYPGVNVV